MQSRVTWVLAFIFLALAIGCLLLVVSRARKRPLGFALESTDDASPKPPVFRPLNQSDVNRLNEQRRVVAEALSRLQPGATLHGDRSDLPLLQELIDKHVFASNQTYELQCIGVAFGDVLAKELGLHWAIVTDEYGTDPTLQDG